MLREGGRVSVDWNNMFHVCFMGFSDSWLSAVRNADGAGLLSESLKALKTLKVVLVLSGFFQWMSGSKARKARDCLKC